MSLQDKNILVIDDSRATTTFLRDLLHSVGAVVESSPNGQLGLERANGASPRFDLILVDYRLPDIDGLEVIRSIREHDDECAIVMITGVGAVQTPSDALRQGADGYVVKQHLSPQESRPFLQTLEQAMRHRSDVMLGMRAQQELQESEKQFRSLAEAIPHIVWRSSGDGTIDYVNARWKDYFGVSLNGTRSWRDVLDAADVSSHGAQRLGLMQAGQSYETQVRLRREDGEFRWHLVREVPLSSGGDKVWIGSATDIDDQMRARDVLEQVKENLEERVAERTRELLALNSRLTELDRMKSEFLAMMSHELRTPLNSIIGFTDIILSQMAGPVTTEQTKQLAMVASAGHHLLSLINDLLEVSRLETHGVIVEAEPFKLAALAADVIASMQPLLTVKKVTLELAHSDPDMTLVSDERKVRQILLNIIGNAVKFTQEGSIRVSLRRDGDDALVEVTDSGIGIASGDLSKIFNAFVQGDSSSRRHYEGTGLGLYLSQKLADLLGASIAATSTVGVGSTFVLRLPLHHLAGKL